MKRNVRKNWTIIGVLFICFSMLFPSISFAETDVTGDIQFVQSRLYYDRGAKQSYLDVGLKNISSTDVLLSPITVVIESINPSSITVANSEL